MAYIGNAAAGVATSVDSNTVEEGDIQNSAVTTAKIADAAVTDAKIDTVSSSKLTGALPALDGSALTGIDSLPSQTGNSGKYLTTDGTTASWGLVSGFDSGTVMLFAQTSAPTGWTKDTTNYNNSGLRIVTGSASTGGSIDFTAAFASQTPSGSVSVSGGSVGSTTLSTSEIPSHQHLLGLARNDRPGVFLAGYTSGGGGTVDMFSVFSGSYNYQGYSQNAGGGGAHSHSFSAPSASFSGNAINLAVKYVDVIRATKD